MPLTWPIVAVILAGMACVTTLGALGKIDSMTLGAVFSFVIGGALGHANGFRQGINQGSGH